MAHGRSHLFSQCRPLPAESAESAEPRGASPRQGSGDDRRHLVSRAVIGSLSLSTCSPAQRCRYCPPRSCTRHCRSRRQPLSSLLRGVFHPPSSQRSGRLSRRGATRLVPLAVLTLATLICTCPQGAMGEERRDKKTDENYQALLPLADIPSSCDGRGGSGYGIVDGGLEKCDVYGREAGADDQEANDYQRFRCANLRVHAQVTRSGQCECEKNWKGSICNEYVGCPEGYSLFNGVCTPNVCQHGGQLAVGSKQIECICDAPWDGRYCDRLACWRMASKEHERRWRNADDHCKCAEGFDGDECDVIVSCKNGELTSGRCVCADGWKGEICERKCIPNQTCSASALHHHPLMAGLISTLLLLAGCRLFWPVRL